MIARRVHFTVPALPPTLNVWSRLHWSARARYSRDWKLWIRAHAPDVPMFHKPVVVTLTFVCRRRRDADGMPKFVLDGLVGRILQDDGPDCVAELRLRVEVSRSAKACTRIEVQAAAGMAEIERAICGQT